MAKGSWTTHTKKAFGGLGRDIGDAVKTNLLGSNSKIADAWDDAFGMATSLKEYNKTKNLGSALKAGYMNGPNNTLNMTNVIGTAAAASVAGRVVSGGGITKDSNGNTNIVVLPFI